MLFNDTYYTIAVPAEGSFRDKGSKFLGFAFPIHSDAEAKEYLDFLRKSHPKASHCCFAYRLGLDRSQYRTSDDGEPTGSAGKPILNTLYSHDLTNVLVVVVRYFGGTLLGIPGLIYAYKAATDDAVKQTTIIKKIVQDVYELRFPFEQMNNVMRAIKDIKAHVRKQNFEERCILEISIRKTHVEQLSMKLSTIENLGVQYLCTI